MELVADRFVVMDDRRVVDLATGVRVVLRVANGGDPPDERGWAIRCGALQKLRHRFVASLLDYGTLGQSQRFEAWQCGSRWIGARTEAERALAAASRFLHSCGLTAGNERVEEAVRSSGHGAVVLPDETTGYPRAEESAGEELSLDMCGLTTLERSATATVTELFQLSAGSRPQLVVLVGPSGSGKTTLVQELARSARLNGFVPVAAGLMPLLDHGHDRSLCLLDDDSRGAWSPLLEAAIRRPRPHVLIMTAREEVRSVDGIGLGRVSPDALVAAVRPQIRNPAVLKLVRRAAVQAQGLPGKFVQTLWSGLAEDGGRRDRRVFTRAAEQPAAYGQDEAAEPEPSRQSPVRPWPAPGELAMLRRRLAAATSLLDGGRHATGIRKLRQAVAGLARRDDWEHAANGAIALGSALLRRGRPKDAQAVFDQAKHYCTRSGRDASLLDVATLCGEAWIDMARLDEAEAVIGAVLASARAGKDDVRLAAASLALGRCLFWQGRYADAELAIARSAGVSLPIETRLRLTCLAARIAVGRRDFTRAMACATDAMEQARAEGDRRAQAAAACTAAFVHLAVGDLDAAARDGGISIAAARAARDPLRAIRARLILAEVDRRRDRRSAAATTVNRLRRVDASRLPPIVRARCDLLNELISSSALPPEVAARRAASTGLEALALYLPDAGAPGSRFHTWDSLADEIVDILAVCQTAEEEHAVLNQVCGRLRRHLHAASVAYIATERTAHAVLSANGAPVEVGIVERVMNAGVTIAPHRREDRLEAAAPVRHGGSIIGVLAARWTLGSSYDLSRAPAILTMAATAAAPVVAAALARRAGSGAPALDALLGVTPAMMELRRAVERAATAPFAVLIEGESGVGKELVARAVHRLGSRRDRPFSTLNCAALPEDLVEAELFGHVRGAFTGAVGDRAGVFEEAHGGTLLLDEVGELSPRAQAKVLRVIQEGELRRVGENTSRRVDVRIVAATNRDLRQEASAGRFRLDLLYRLDVIRLSVPPLRERREDIAVFVGHFWNDATGRVGSRATLAAATVGALARYDWPGNVRELQNVLAALAVRCPKRGVVPPSALPPQCVARAEAESCRLDEARRTFEERFVRAALIRTGGRRAPAAAELGVTRQGLTKLMTRLGITD